MKLKRFHSEYFLLFEKETTAIGNKIKNPDLHGEVLKACRNKQAFLFFCNEGFVVLKPSSNGVLVWLAHSFRTVDISEFQKEIEQLCFDIGALQVMFWTVRKGFRRIIPKLGYVRSEALENNVLFDVWVKSL